MDPHRAGPFTGLVVSTTNFNLPQRQDVEAVVVKGGGTFSPELQKGVCTHLVCGKAEGPKYRWDAGCWRRLLALQLPGCMCLPCTAAIRSCAGALAHVMNTTPCSAMQRHAALP